MDIQPTRTLVQSVEESLVILSCNYSSSAYSLQWYRQYPGSTPRFLLLSAPNTKQSVVRAKPEDLRLNINFNEDNARVDLKIYSAALTDSALYYCALQPTVSEKACTLYKNLHRLLMS